MTAGRLDYWRLKLHALGCLLVGRRDAAHASFSSMLALWPNNAYVLSSRAHLSAQMGRPEAALTDAQALTAAHPTRGAGDWFNLGFLLDQAGRLDEAESAFRRALTLDPKLDRGWYGLGLVLIRLRRLDEALAALKRNTELQPMSPYGWYPLARLHVDRQDPDEARRIIGRLKGFEPKFAAQLERETGRGPDAGAERRRGARPFSLRVA